MRSFVSLFWCELAGVRWTRPHWVPEGRTAQSGHNAVIVMAPPWRVHNPGVREHWILFGDDFSTVFPFSAQCLARQWLRVHMFKSCGVARCSDWKMFTEVGEGEKTSEFGLRMCMLTPCGRHWQRQCLPVLRTFGRISQPSLVWLSRA